MKDSLIVFGGLVGAPVVRLEATVDIVPLTEVGSHFRQTADAQSAGEFQLEPFIVGQVDDHGVFIEASELWRVIRIAENWMKECFACALPRYSSAFATKTPLSKRGRPRASA